MGTNVTPRASRSLASQSPILWTSGRYDASAETLGIATAVASLSMKGFLRASTLGHQYNLGRRIRIKELALRAHGVLLTDNKCRIEVSGSDNRL